MTILVLILAVVAVWFVFSYNRLVRLRNQVRTAWADIDVQLTRRHDLVPQLVSAVRGYASHEQTVLQAVTDLRSQALTLQSPARLGEVETALEQALSRVLALKEAYPDLKASENFTQLQRDLVKVEETLQYARRFYNGAVRDYNDGVQRVPDVVLARGVSVLVCRVLPGTRRGAFVGTGATAMITRIVVVLLAVFVCSSALADERILSYDIEVRVGRDGALDVTERITVRAEGARSAAASIATSRHAIATAMAIASSSI